MKDAYGNEMELKTIDLAGFPGEAEGYKTGDKFTTYPGAPGTGRTEYVIHNINGTKLLCSVVFNNVRILEPCEVI